MKDRKLIQRALLRRSLRKEMRHAESSDAGLIQLALDDDAIFETLYEQAMQNARLYGNSTGLLSITTAEDGSPIVDNLLRLLQWFVDNGPMLIDIIRLMMELLGGSVLPWNRVKRKRCSSSESGWMFMANGSSNL